jgi:hypothetical protein
MARRSAISGAVALLLASAGASSSTPSLAANEWLAEAIPAPVSGAAIFPKSMADAQGCVTETAVAEKLKSDEFKVGGKTVVLTDGLEQAFADAWRRHASLSVVPVHSVFAHIFALPPGSDVLLVDVVETDGKGCAMTRTLISGAVWKDLLQSAVGIEV